MANTVIPKHLWAAIINCNFPRWKAEWEHTADREDKLIEEVIVEMKKTITRITQTLDIMDGSACPHRIRTPYIDKCDINDKPCLLEEGLECDE